MQRQGTWIGALTVVLALCAGPGMAQIHLGLVGDLNLAQQSTDVALVKDYMKTLVRPGFGALVELAVDDNLSFVSEPMYLGKGAKASASVAGVEGSVKLKLAYIEVPLFVKYALGKSGPRPYILAGPTIGFKTSAKAVGSISGLGDLLGISGGEAEMDVSDRVKSSDFGLGVGGGVQLPLSSNSGARAFLEAQYVIGLENIDATGTETTKNKGFQIRAGVALPIGATKK